ncbi:hypothetical protein Hokovirus_1_302 [Hokovirus HKV1]|uniref:Uncharacterized protein n=1 Tax=Hokovirus HKV1 TaxID=1977638 RepID=A0A1V0SFE1_9VIRU|nr:hypothetical protein Hokovirus_1_302 [Hokovirus HKV1]
MELNILNLVSILENGRHVLKNEDNDVRYKYINDIPDIYDIIIIMKSDCEIYKMRYGNYHGECTYTNYRYAGETNNIKVYVNITYVCMFSNIGYGKLLCNYDKANYHIIVKTCDSIMYENIEKMQKYLPLKIMTRINESDIKVLKPFFNITKITTIELSDVEINLFLFTKRETLTKAAINKP